MFTNRAIKLLKLLQPHEQEEFLAYLKKQNKAKCHLTAKSILKFIRKGEAKTTKEGIFFEIYKYEYTVEQDYLLRNDFRLLSREIEDFLGSSEIFPLVTEIKALNYLHILLRSNDMSFLEKEFSAKESQFENPNLKEWFGKMHQQFYFQNLGFKEKNVEYFDQILEKQLKNVLENTAIKLAEINVRRSFSNRLKSLMGLEFSTDIPYNYQIELLSDEQNASIKYLSLKSLTYNKTGDEAIELLKQCNELLLISNSKYFNVQEEEIWVLSNLGFHYFWKSDFTNSEKYFKQSLSHAYIDQYKLKGNILYNYISACLKNHNYEQATQIFKKYKEDIDSSTRLEDKFKFHRILILLYNKDFKEAKQILFTSQAPDGSSEYYYFRTLSVLIFILNDEFERANMELRNYRQTRYNSPEISKLHKSMCNVFKHYLRLYERLDTLHIWEEKSAELIESTLSQQSPRTDIINYYDSILIDFLRTKISELKLKHVELEQEGQ